MQDIRIINVPRHDTDNQIYMQSFCEAWIRNGGKYVERKQWIKKSIIKNTLKALALTGISFRGNKKFLVCARGGHLLKSALPYNFYGEVIPMLWDCWPETWNKLERDIKLLGCHTVLITASDVARIMSERLPNVRFIHIPEAVDIGDYKNGKDLRFRETDVYELGRKHEIYHQKIVADKFVWEKHKLLYCPNTKKKAAFLFNSWDTFTDQLRNTKIIISFPASMIDADKASIETLTIRYWEAMLSRCVIVGHGPKELSDLLGYNPVIEADFERPTEQLVEIIDHIENYQPLVDKNYEAALRMSSWDVRMKRVFDVLGKQNG